MVIDVIREGNTFVFLRFLGNGKKFSGEIFCIAFRKNFQIIYNRVSTNPISLT